MKLSEEIRLGSLLIMKPERNDLRACAIGMANLAAGFCASGAKDDAAYHHLVQRHPWLAGINRDCPVCNRTMYGSELVWHPFDGHVMKWKYVDFEMVLTPQMSIEQLSDFIASVEPDEPVAKLMEGRAPVCTETAKFAV